MRNGSFSSQILASAIRHGGSSGPDVAGMGLTLEANGLLRCDTTEGLNSFTAVVKVWVFVGSYSSIVGLQLVWNQRLCVRLVKTHRQA